jgi:hypothetical protein
MMNKAFKVGRASANLMPHLKLRKTSAQILVSFTANKINILLQKDNHLNRLCSNMCEVEDALMEECKCIEEEG